MQHCLPASMPSTCELCACKAVQIRSGIEDPHLARTHPACFPIRLTSQILQLQTNRNRFALFPVLDDARLTGVALCSGQIRVTSCAAHLARRSFQSVAYERRTSHVYTSS